MFKCLKNYYPAEVPYSNFLIFFLSYRYNPVIIFRDVAKIAIEQCCNSETNDITK